jgi:hypothetical protein
LLQFFSVSVSTFHAGGWPTVLTRAIPPASNDTKHSVRPPHPSGKSSKIPRADTVGYMLSVESVSERHNTHVCCANSKPCKHQTVPVHGLQVLLASRAGNQHAACMDPQSPPQCFIRRT